MNEWMDIIWYSPIYIYIYIAHAIVYIYICGVHCFCCLLFVIIDCVVCLLTMLTMIMMLLLLFVVCFLCQQSEKNGIRNTRSETLRLAKRRMKKKTEQKKMNHQLLIKEGNREKWKGEKKWQTHTTQRKRYERRERIDRTTILMVRYTTFTFFGTRSMSNRRFLRRKKEERHRSGDLSSW